MTLAGPLQGDLRNESAAASAINAGLGGSGRAYTTPHGYIMIESASTGRVSTVKVHPNSSDVAARLLGPALSAVVGVDLSLRSIGVFLRREFNQPQERIVYIIETQSGRLMGSSLPIPTTAEPAVDNAANTNSATLCSSAAQAAAAPAAGTNVLGSCANTVHHTLIRSSAIQLESLRYANGTFVVSTHVAAEAKAISFNGLRWTLVVLQTWTCDPGTALR